MYCMRFPHLWTALQGALGKVSQVARGLAGLCGISALKDGVELAPHLGNGVLHGVQVDLLATLNLGEGTPGERLCCANISSRVPGDRVANGTVAVLWCRLIMDEVARVLTYEDPICHFGVRVQLV